MTKKPRKSILANFASYAPAAPPSPDSEAETKANAERPKTRVGAGIVEATHRSLTELREERDRLRALVEQGGAAEIDPDLIDPSPYPDRLPDDDAAGFAAFRQQIETEGQVVPIQLRRKAGVEGRYEIVYGHRRWRAARELGRKVKAQIVDFDDRELLLAQGIENSARQDLTWIEKALFADIMERAEIKARDIRSALSVDDGELARYRAVLKSIPVSTVQKIGRAPKAGRGRWVELGRLCAENRDAFDRIDKVLADAETSTSDQRFALALRAAQPKKEKAGKPKAIPLVTAKGQEIGKVAFGRSDIKISLADDQADAFKTFLEDELPALVERYLAGRN
ncbi:plasmid partitioning protein RepB [Martelella alba]|uniref:Plasmid partitioning protein RepB n=1 Tax=Martelella alba TaxID=2590451 RepID=A0A506TZ31_9HYPH|nr:plasmid partitioning protein RepB [Martelella alba]TPW27342.1 plasmid partitioning protein RepB [Martelella alba]